MDPLLLQRLETFAEGGVVIGAACRVVGALLMFQRASSARRDTLRLTIDSLIVVIGGGIVVWHTLFRPILA